MKLVTDNAFTKAWEISCPTCRIDQPHSMLWFKKQCHECEIKDMADKKYTEDDIKETAYFFVSKKLAANQGILDEEIQDFIESLNKQD